MVPEDDTAKFDIIYLTVCSKIFSLFQFVKPVQ